MDSEKWQTLVVKHYFDEVVEAMRRQLIRFTIQSPEPHIWSEKEKTQLLTWMTELRS
ncbi:hypothetical protein [Nostoc sp. PCC 7107]|uniref:hypothetical protein n=1 Tax=Nostoc sp. PCC 7107 TaxID=317936 RepID=UPI00029ECEF8|nr:hypothetical protein [Nostoc sp. PCC 7107]AFY41596.1 G2/mitotic-specific cyclin, putative [Nostoc sp. PCC 7107]